MGWRTNPVVGAVAVILVVLGAAGIWWYFGTDSRSGGYAETKWGTFRCKSTDERFVISLQDMESLEIYEAYYSTTGQDVRCEVCGGDDAIRVYYDRVEDKWYDYTPEQANAITITSPAGNVIPDEDM